MDISAIDRVLERLSAMPRQGASYAHMGRKGWSNPIRKDTGLLLQVLTASVNPKRVLEVGTAHGESLLNIIKGAPQAEFHTIEWLPELAAEARENFNEAGVDVSVYNGDAMQILDGLEGRFDLVFLDANKDGYYEQIVKLRALGLLPSGAWVMADNVIDRKDDCEAFLTYMRDTHPSLILPTECGLLIGQIQ